MRLLMFLRDPLPPARVDVRVLFDRCLRREGIATDFAGHADTGTVPLDGAGQGGLIDLGPRHSIFAAVRALGALWRHRRDYDLLVVRDRPLLGVPLFALAAALGLQRVYWMSFPIPLGDRIAARDHRRAGRALRALLVYLRGAVAEAVERGLTLRLARHVFVQSEAMRAAILRTHRVSAQRVSAVPMGVDSDDLERLPPPPRALSEGAWIGYLGVLDRARRLEVLIEAFAQVCARRASARLLLIGTAPRAADVQWLRDEACRHGVLDKVHFAGALPMREAWSLMQGVDVAVSPIPGGPLYDVSSPTKVLEYLALGLPVVASDIPDQRELLAACGGGRCVPFDAASLAEAMAELLASPHDARQAAGAARARALALRAYPVLGRQVAAALRRCEA